MRQPAIAELTVEADVPLSGELSESSIASLALHVLREESADGAWTLGFRFVNDAVMQAMHLEFMGLDSPTDIMTFPIDDDEDWAFGGDAGMATSQGGDIVISVERAAEQAVDGNWGLDQELQFLIIHGILHLLDWDDHDNADRAAMLDRQRFLLGAWQEDQPTT